MRALLLNVGWLACIIYSTIPLFWLMIHPFADRWRGQKRSPYLVLIPVWTAMWVVMALITWPWRRVEVYQRPWTWIPALLPLVCGLYLYSRSGEKFSAKLFGGLPEVHRGNEQRLVTEGIRARMRHPIYLAHLCEMLAWSLGTGLAVNFGMTAFAIIAGAVMIRMEDSELEKRFGDSYRAYRTRVPAIIPRV